MCGIVGYVGSRTSVPLIVRGLEKLEYRGYDSAGVATILDGSFQCYRSVGKLKNLKANLTEHGVSLDVQSGSSVSCSIGHTRWATHGRPTEVNAHPHVAGDVCVVHNGIIENYNVLREELVKEGCQFNSETDTEIAAFLIDKHYRESSNILEALKNACARMEGSYALVVLSLKEPNRIVVAKHGSPVIIGVGEGESFAASDIPAILEYTRDILILEDGEFASLSPEETYIEDASANRVERAATKITWDPIAAEKGGYRHFMLKEIHEQPQVATDTFRGRIEHEEDDVFLDDIGLTDEEIKQFDQIKIVACGSAWHAGLVGKFYLEQLSNINVEVDYASEFRYRNPVINDKTLCVVVSQSGETIDTLYSLNLAKEKGATTLAVCNVVGSTISRAADNVFYTHAGPEISVASTKAFLSQLVALYMIAIRFGSARGSLSDKKRRELLENLTTLPSAITECLKLEKKIERLSRKYGKSESFLFLGRGLLYPIALEGALKLKEISYLHASGYPAGELKHGPIALVSEETPVVICFGRDGVNYEKAMSNLMEVESRGGQVIAITDESTPELEDIAWEVLSVGKVPPMLLPMVLTIPLQMLSYYVAVFLGTDVDQPRNLAKSVTVE